jgi:DHA1 family inner membrane transport protein
MGDFSVADVSTALPADAGPGRGSLPWAPLLVLSCAAFATVTAELLPASLLLELADDLAVPESTAGLLVTAWALTLAASSIPLVRATARVPRRTLLLLVLLVFAVATAGTAAAPTFEWAMASRIVAAAAHGVFWSLLVPITAALVRPEVVGRAVSVVLAGPAVAGVVGIPLGAAIGTGVGWRASFGAIGITVLNLGIAAGAALGGLVLDWRGAATLPVAAAALIAVAAVELLIAGRAPRPARAR